MSGAGSTLALQELERLIGREVPLDQIHGTLRRVAMGVRGIAEGGTFLVTCSDEFNGEIRAGFEREVARVLNSSHVPGNRRVFAVSNMGGRVEPGGLMLADDHFASRSRTQGTKMLLVEIAAHVGRRDATTTSAGAPRPPGTPGVPGATGAPMVPQATGPIWGELDRFGQVSPCCGALDLLLRPTPSTAAVRHPWFDQLTAFFGPERLEFLRADRSPFRMVRAAVVHAVLQAESALADLLRERPRSATHFLVVALVAVNQRGSDTGILVGHHHLHFDGTEMHFEHGVSLRTTPAALRVAIEGGRLRVEAEVDRDAERTAPALAAPATALHPRAVEQTRRPEVRAHLERTRAQVQRLRGKRIDHRVYARPLLRGLLQGLSLIAPEVGLAAMAIQGGAAALRMRRIHDLLERGPSTEDARRVLHDLEAEIQQLGHREAADVLEILLAERAQLAGGR